MKPQSRTSEVSAGTLLIWMVSACLDDPQGSRPPVLTAAVKTSHKCLRLSQYPLLLRNGWKKREKLKGNQTARAGVQALTWHSSVRAFPAGQNAEQVFGGHRPLQLTLADAFRGPPSLQTPSATP